MRHFSAEVKINVLQYFLLVGCARYIFKYFHARDFFRLCVCKGFSSKVLKSGSKKETIIWDFRSLRVSKIDGSVFSLTTAPQRTFQDDPMGTFYFP